ncbi:MAG: FRG domain-containing protein [Lachnospiraceae bacterium]|nr:FRG domain-containing protein [Lachnospiraceae bacterium]
MITTEISTIDELLQFAKALSARHGSNAQLWYRGEENSALTLVPSIQRSERRLEMERFLSNDFYVRAMQIFNNPPAKHDYAHWVALMQHYGLPTRILDWSRSPLIAVFFATETYQTAPDTDACVWVLVPDRLNETEGFGRCIYPIDADTAQEMLLPAFKHLHHNPVLEDKILACASTDRNLRMYSQQSCFTVHNSLRRLEDICDDQMLYKIIIPHDSKKSFIESLKALGITQGFIYPDLEHICRDLRDFYDI